MKDQAFIDACGPRLWANEGDIDLLVDSEDIDPESVPEDKPLSDVREAVPPGEGNLVGSRCEDGTHMPTIDIDFPCRLVESTTPGHFHLYIDKAIRKSDYLLLLDVMESAGLVQKGFVTQMRRFGSTYLRPPWVKKETKEGDK